MVVAYYDLVMEFKVQACDLGAGLFDIGSPSAQIPSAHAESQGDSLARVWFCEYL